MASNQSQESNDESLVWGGSLYYNPRRPKRPHKSCKYWCEFHREVSHVPRELRFYQNRANGAQNRQNVVGTIPLECDIVEVVSGVNYGHSTSFKIVTRVTEYIIGTDVSEQAESWTYAIWKELFGPVENRVVYNFNVIVEQNRTAQEFNIMGSYLLKIFDEEVKLFSANGQISTKFREPIKNIVKASSIDLANKPRHVISFAVLNIDSSENGGDVMVFQANCAHDIARVINHRKDVLFKSSTGEDLPKQPLVIDLHQQSGGAFVPEQVIKTLSPPQSPRVAAVTKKKKSRTNPDNHFYANFNAVVSHRTEFNEKSKAKISKSTRKTKAPLLSSKPKQDKPQKSSEPSIAVNSTKNLLSRGNRKKSEPIMVVNDCRLTKVKDYNRSPSNIDRLIPSNVADKRLSVSARPPAPLPRSLASLDTGLVPDSNMTPSKSDSQILNYHQKGEASSLQVSLDHIYSDPNFEMDPEDSSMWKKDESPANSDGESNYSDSELWLCKKQKKLSQRSKKLGQKQKSGGCNRKSTDDQSLYANCTNNVVDVLSPKKENESPKSSHQMYNGQTSPQEVDLTQSISSDHIYSRIGRLHDDPLPRLPPVCTLLPQQTHEKCSNHIAVFHCRSDSELCKFDSVHHKRKASPTTKSNTTGLDHEDDNYSDSEVWLSKQQSKFSRRSKKSSQRKRLLKSQTSAKALFHIEGNVNTDDSATYKPSGLDMASSISQEKYNSQSSRLMNEQSPVHKYFMIRQKEGVPLPTPSPFYAVHRNIKKRRSRSLEDSSVMVPSDTDSVYTDLLFDMEDIATWRKYLSTSAVSATDPNYKQRLLASKNSTSPRHFDGSPTGLTPQSALKMNNPQGSLPSDAAQHSESLFSMSPDSESYYTDGPDVEPYEVVDLPPHKYWRIARNNQPLPNSPIMLKKQCHRVLSTCSSYEGSDHVYSMPRTSNLLERCNSVDDCYYSDSESWLYGSNKAVDSKVSHRLNEDGDHDSKEEMRNPDPQGIKKKPQVSPRLCKPVVAPRKNVFATATPLHNNTGNVVESAKLSTNGNKSGYCTNDPSVSLPACTSYAHNQLLASSTKHRTSRSSSRFSSSFLIRCNTGSSQGSRTSSGDAIYLELISSANHTYSYCYLDDLQREINTAAQSDNSSDPWLAHIQRHFKNGSKNFSFHHYQNVPDIYKCVHSGEESNCQDQGIYQDQDNFYELLSSSVPQSSKDDIHSKTSKNGIKKLNSQDFTTNV